MSWDCMFFFFSINLLDFLGISSWFLGCLKCEKTQQIKFQKFSQTKKKHESLWSITNFIVKHHHRETDKERQNNNKSFATHVLILFSWVLQHRSLRVVATWGHESFMEISTFHRSPGDFFFWKTSCEDEGNLTQCHFTNHIDSGWWRIIDSVDISWHHLIWFDNIWYYYERVCYFGPSDHEVAIDATHKQNYVSVFFRWWYGRVLFYGGCFHDLRIFQGHCHSTQSGQPVERKHLFNEWCIWILSINSKSERLHPLYPLVSRYPFCLKELFHQQKIVAPFIVFNPLFKVVSQCCCRNLVSGFGHQHQLSLAADPCNLALPGEGFCGS